MKPLIMTRKVVSAITRVNEGLKEVEWNIVVGDDAAYDFYLMTWLARIYEDMSFLEDVMEDKPFGCIFQNELFDCAENDDELEATYNKMRELIMSAKSDFTEKLRVPGILEEWEKKSGEKRAIAALENLDRFESYVLKIGHDIGRLGEIYGLVDLKEKNAIIEYLASTDTPSTPSADTSNANESNIPIKVRELFSSADACDDFFRDGDSLICAEWAKRAFRYEHDNKLYFYANGDIMNLYNEIKRQHPKIAKYGTFQRTRNNLNNKCTPL